MSLFEGRDLACVRGERRVFEHLSFAVAEGGLTVLTGANGSGKSSLLRLMAGLLPPAGGGLYWDGMPIARDPEAHRARLRYIGHLDAVKPVLSAAENLRFWSAPGSDAESAEAALDGFGLAALAGVPVRIFSAGQKRRLALARLLTVPAELWLLDEPGVGLDRESLGRLAAAIAGHRARGGRVVAATHVPLDLPGARTLELGRFQPEQIFAAEAGW